MIILMNSTPYNKQTGSLLSASYGDNHIFDIANPAPSTNEYEDKICFIVDMNLPSDFNYNADAFANKLTKSGLPNSVKDIYMVASDIIPGHKIMTFSNQLSTVFSKEYRKKINIHVVTSLNFDITFIVPPEKNNNKWIVYGLNRTDTNESLITEKDIHTIQNKHILFEGENILEWMNNNQRILNGINYTWGEA